MVPLLPAQMVPPPLTLNTVGIGLTVMVAEPLISDEQLLPEFVAVMV